MNIIFKEITNDNWYECANLSVHDHQKGFIAPNAYSLAQAIYEDEPLIVRAIYNDDAMIGFIMYCINEADKTAWIWRYMMDKNFQGKGYGKAALTKILEIFEFDLNCKEVRISEAPENIGAKKLYCGLGFEFTGEIEYGEEVMLKIFSSNN